MADKDDRLRCRLYLITPPDIYGDTADRVRSICHDRDVALIMNDRADLAAKADCDGVHVGQTDTPYGEARSLLGTDAIVGVTCHASKHLAMEAGEAGANYVAFGAFFDSTTKQRKHVAEPELLEQWQESMLVPCVAIGGITIENCRPIVEAGADFIAVAAGVWAHSDGPGAAVKAFNEIFDKVASAR